MAFIDRCCCWTACGAWTRVSRAAVVALVTLMGVAGAARAEVGLGFVLVAGELIVDLDASDLLLGSDAWRNRAVSDDSVGDFTTLAGGPLNIASNVSVEGGSVYRAVDVRGAQGASLVSMAPTPATLQGNGARSVEAWVIPTGAGDSTVAGWGDFGPNEWSAFRFTTGGNGMFAGYFNDGAWDSAAVVNDHVGKLTHLAWTYDGDTLLGYVNGVPSGSADLFDLDTEPGLLQVGAGRPSSYDPFNGYVAGVRVHTGVLSPFQVLNNYESGCCLFPPTVCDFDNDSDCDSADFSILVDNLFTSRPEDGTRLIGDWDGDSDVDLDDYLGMKNDFRRVVGVVDPFTAGASEVPEPAASVCLVIALTTIAAWRPMSPSV